MEFTEVMQQLEEMGTAQNRKIYGRHGVKREMFGVSWANLKILKKKIKIDQPLAEALWETGIHDARILATMIADARQMNGATLEQWGHGLDNYVISDSFSGLVGQSSLAREKMARWTLSDDEWFGQAGWNLLAHLAMKDKDLSDDYFRPYLDTIATDIHNRKNRVRYSMNNALISIGIRNSTLEAEAVAVARKIGKVEVDHGQTSCKTPDAEKYIERTLARKRK